MVSVTLAALAAIGQLTPGVLLALTFLGGAGSGVTAPAWQAMIPDLVSRTQIRAASVLGSVSVNVGRAVGPALAGLLIAGIGVAPVFALNAASFIVFAGVLLWAHRRPHRTLHRGASDSCRRCAPGAATCAGHRSCAAS